MILERGTRPKTIFGKVTDRKLKIDLIQDVFQREKCMARIKYKN